MNGKELVELLGKDVFELNNILSELSIGKSLNIVEYKFIQSRTRTIIDDVDMLREFFNENNVEINPHFFADNKQTNISSKKKNFEQINEQISKTLNKVSQTLENNIEELSEIENTETIKEPLNYTDKEEENIDTLELSEEISNGIESETEVENLDNDVSEENAHKTLADKFEGSTNTLNDKMSSTFEKKDLASKLAGKPISDLTKAINLNDKVRFISEIFSGSSDNYQEIISKINQMSEFDEALQLFEQLPDFNQDAPSFNDFIEFIYRRFIK